jgi:hypothetical protein
MESITINEFGVWEADRDCTVTVKEGIVFQKFKSGGEETLGFGPEKKIPVKQGDRFTSNVRCVLVRPEA